MFSSWPLSMDECIKCHTCRISNQFSSFHIVAFLGRWHRKPGAIIYPNDPHKNSSQDSSVAVG